MVDRRALIIGSWLAQGRDRPSPQKVKSLTDRWGKIFGEDTYKFRSLADPDLAPVPLLNPRSAEIIEQLDEAKGLSGDTELLVYFIGHSISDGENDLKLILGTGAEGADRTISLSWLPTSIRQHTPARKLVVILDTCHAGRTRETLRTEGFDAFAMFATGSAYAFEAEFSDGLLRALEQRVQKSDQRIDRRAGGITYRKIFEEARRRVLLGGNQDPNCFGDYADTVLLPVSAKISSEYNSFAHSRSIYARLNRLLQLVGELNPSIDQLRDAVDREDIFVLRRDDEGDHKTISTARLSEYIDFARKVRWVVEPHGRYQLTKPGQRALNDLYFNQLLLEAIEEHVLPEKRGFAFLDRVVKELLYDMIPPTPVRIKDRAAMLGVVIELDEATRLALQLLPSTGQFLKGSADAIYPSEYAG